MENSDRLVEETEFGKLMETNRNEVACHKCKYENHNRCRIITNYLCEPNDYYYFLKENTDENT